MEVSRILVEIDAQIAKLQQARALLAGTASSKQVSGSVKTPAAPKKRSKRVLSPEARKKIAEAQKRRWAAQRKAK